MASLLDEKMELPMRQSIYHRRKSLKIFRVGEPRTSWPLCNFDLTKVLVRAIVRSLSRLFSSANARREWLSGCMRRRRMVVCRWEVFGDTAMVREIAVRCVMNVDFVSCSAVQYLLLAAASASLMLSRCFSRRLLYRVFASSTLSADAPSLQLSRGEGDHAIAVSRWICRISHLCVLGLRPSVLASCFAAYDPPSRLSPNRRLPGYCELCLPPSLRERWFW